MATTSTSPASSRSTRPRDRALAVGGAVLTTALLWTAARWLGIELRVDPHNGQPPGVIGLPFAAAVTLIVSLLGWGARAALDRMTRRAALVWRVLAAIVLLLSFLPVLGVGATAGTKVILALAHLAVAAALIPVLGRGRP